MQTRYIGLNKFKNRTLKTQKFGFLSTVEPGVSNFQFFSDLYIGLVFHNYFNYESIISANLNLFQYLIYYNCVKRFKLVILCI